MYWRIPYNRSVPPQSNRFHSLIPIAIAVLIVAASFGGGVYIGYEHRPAIEQVRGVLGQETGKPEEVDFSQFWEVWAEVEQRYVDREHIDRQKLVQGAIGGLVHALGDPYTVYFPPVQAKQFQEDVRGTFGGIGAEIGMRKDVLTVITPLKGSPAEQSGLLAGDKIFQISGTSTEGLTLDEAVGYIRGEIGTSVKLTIGRDTTVKEVSIVRDKIVVPILITERKDGGVFYIHLLNFNEGAPGEFRNAMREFEASGSKKLLLDLRGNPGGFLDAAVDIASWFLPRSSVVAIERSGDGSEHLYRSVGRNAGFDDVQMIVLVNQGSASAAEILAGALRDARSVTLVGEKTFGKGSVQAVENLDGGASLKITIAKWLTPNGHSINDRGIDPDVVIELTPEDAENGRDPQLDKALEMIRAR